MAILPVELPVFRTDTSIYGIVSIPVCTKADWDFAVYSSAMNSQRLCVKALERMGAKLPEHTPLIVTKKIIDEYRAFITEYCQNNLDIFEIPEKPDFEGELSEKLKTTIVTFEQSYIHQHTGLNFNEIQELNILEYKMLLADAVKIKMLTRADGKGKEYLNDCYNAMHHISNMF